MRRICCVVAPQYSIGGTGAGSGSGMSVTSTSVVRIIPAMLAAVRSASRVPLAASMIPTATRPSVVSALCDTRLDGVLLALARVERRFVLRGDDSSRMPGSSVQGVM